MSLGELRVLFDTNSEQIPEVNLGSILYCLTGNIMPFSDYQFVPNALVTESFPFRLHCGTGFGSSGYFSLSNWTCHTCIEQERFLTDLIPMVVHVLVVKRIFEKNATVSSTLTLLSLPSFLGHANAWHCRYDIVHCVVMSTSLISRRKEGLFPEKLSFDNPPGFLVIIIIRLRRAVRLIRSRTGTGVGVVLNIADNIILGAFREQSSYAQGSTSHCRRRCTMTRLFSVQISEKRLSFSNRQFLIIFASLPS